MSRAVARSLAAAFGGALRGAPLLSFCLSLACSSGCRSEPASREAASADAAPARPATGPVGGARPLEYLRVPASYDAAKPSPLVLVLHGYGSTGAAHAGLFTLGELPERERIIVAAPDGTVDSQGARFWNAVPACCDFDARGIDDVAYLRGLVADLRARYAIDPKRIYAVGHSNGGAMALRLACDEAATFAAVVDLSGPFYADGTDACHPTEPVSVRIMHGTRDALVPFDGGVVPVRVNPKSGRFPTASARGKAAAFARVDGCDPQPTPRPALDFDLAVPGAETDVTAYEHCRRGAGVELWTMNGVGHSPARPVGWQSAWEFLAAHPKP